MYEVRAQMGSLRPQRQTQAVSELPEPELVEALRETTETEKDGGVEMQGRRFGGWDSPKYFFNHHYITKREANAKAAQLRKSGNFARVVATRYGYEVWDRPGSPGMR
jgi:hypothetical protein